MSRDDYPPVLGYQPNKGTLDPKNPPGNQATRNKEIVAQALRRIANDLEKGPVIDEIEFIEVKYGVIELRLRFYEIKKFWDYFKW